MLTTVNKVLWIPLSAAILLAGCGSSSDSNSKTDTSVGTISSLSTASMSSVSIDISSASNVSLLSSSISRLSSASASLAASSSQVASSPQVTSSSQASTMGSSSSSSSDVVIPDITLGKRSYNAQCSRCHGADGSGGTSQVRLNPPVNPQGLDIIDFIRTAMPKGNPNNCGESCAINIASYILTFLEPSISNGSTIYQNLCIGCHGDNGVGINSRGPALAPSSTPLVNRSIIIDVTMPPSDTESCTGQCAVDAASYVDSLSEPSRQAGQIAYMNLCARCHGDDASGGIVNRPLDPPPNEEGQELIDFIDQNMPADDPQNCKGECAINIANYLESEYR